MPSGKLRYITPVEMIDKLPLNMVMFHSCVNVYQRLLGIPKDNPSGTVKFG